MSSPAEILATADWHAAEAARLRKAARANLIHPPFLGMIGPEIRARHRQRAVERLALQFCGMLWTDGFCTPRATDCADCRCRKMAEAAIGGLDIVGCVVVWEYDPAVKEALGA